MIVRLLNCLRSRPLRGAAIALFLSIALAGCASNPKTKIAKASRGKPASAKKADFPETSDETLQAYAHYATGLSLDMRDDSAAALEEYVKAAEGNPKEEPLVLEVARRLLRNKQGPRAVTLLSKAAEQPSASGLVHSWLGLAYASVGETNKAVAANRTAMQKLPTQIAAYSNLCDLYLALAKTNDIIGVLNEAARQTNAPPDFYVNLADVVLKMQAKDVLGPDESKKRAVTALDRAAALKPDDIVLQQRMAEAYRFHGENAKAQTIFERLFADRPDMPGAREQLINIYLKTDKAKAEAMLNELRTKAPTDPRPHMILGQLALDDNRTPDALEHFETALQLAPGDESLWYRVIALKVAVKKTKEALELLEKAKAKFPRLSFVQEFYTGVTYAGMERYSEALSSFESAELIAKKSEPDRLTAQFYFQLGSAAERARDIEKAVKYFRQSLEMEPDFAEALNYLGYMWAERGENLDEAHKLIAQAIKQEPKNAAFLDSMAWVLLKQNKPAEALPYMKKAVELTKEPDATLFDHLGDILAAMKRTSEAREAWQKALKIEPKEEIRKKLEAGA